MGRKNKQDIRIKNSRMDRIAYKYFFAQKSKLIAILFIL
jgi:hypothetical protein